MDASQIFKPSYHVYSSSTEYRIQKDDSESTVVISRESSTVTNSPRITDIKGKGEQCWGILGISHFVCTHYLIVITQAKFIGRIKDSCIFMVSQIDFKPFQQVSLLETNPNIKKDNSFIEMFKQLIATQSFYFSYDFELTLSIQRLGDLSDQHRAMPLWQRSDYNYFWNNYLTEDFMEVGAHDAILPVINGYVQVQNVIVAGRSFDYGIISRRDHRRTGTRFNTRGLNQAGHAANFVQTEQILGYWENAKYHLFSYVQIRGSIPLLWEQKPTLQYNPKPKIKGDPLFSQEAAGLHFQELVERHGEVYLVNLIDKKGSQKMMGEAFTHLYQSLQQSQIKYTWFDFHDQCKKMKYENLSILLDEVRDSLSQHGWTSAVIAQKQSLSDLLLIQPQKGCFRTNCMDCLDRTNVVQSVLARNAILRQLNQLGIITNITGQAFQSLPDELEQCFRVFWVRNADTMSYLYAGTPAQKTDFTLLQKRTKAGALADGKYSIQRYFINNFMDGNKQNSFDAFLGNLSAKKNTRTIPGKYSNLLFFLMVLVVLGIGCHWISVKNSSKVSYWILMGISLCLVFSGFKMFGSKLVNSPIISN